METILVFLWILNIEHTFLNKNKSSDLNYFFYSGSVLFEMIITPSHNLKKML